ncbi:helix-turn-helix transcriptional regulator [Anaerotruncus rubiinfantis]|mgnify:CR=1 FL=1|uniref:helix-turn-helix transcriptional regulator n=1 Tax=Anaerotruncus rubiinfantis TaxID=1720200 RepID=UPI0034A41DDE
MTKQEIGAIIQAARLRAGLTQNQVAKSINRPQQTIAAWETGRSQPDANTLFQLFSIFGQSVDDAFGFKKEKDPEPERFEVDERERALVLAYRNNPAMQPAVDRLLGLDFSDMPIPDFQRIKTDAENFTREIMKNQNMPAKK